MEQVLNTQKDLSKNRFCIFARRHYRNLVFFVYIAVVLCVMFFHEPWLDEAQAWLIARDSSYHDMIFVRPHYEGHPPFWWLLLSIPAKLGVPYEIGLKGVQLICAMLMAGVLIYRAPFAALAVILLPFTYFVCFQYGVTSRPYALMCAAMFLVASTWKDRDSKPWHLLLSLLLLCCTSSYGIVIACGFAVAWVAHALKDEFSLKAVLLNRRRLAAWITLLVFGLILSIDIIPRSDTFAVRPTSDGNSLCAQFVMFWAVLPSESLITSFAKDVSLRRMQIGIGPVLVCVLISILIWAMLARLAYRRHLLDVLLIPYALLSICAMKYFTMHHLGILFALFVSDLWILAKKHPLGKEDIPQCIKEKINQGAVAELLKQCFIVILLFPSVLWNISAIKCDIQYDYSGARKIASFISDNNLSHDRWVSFWRHEAAAKQADGSVVPERDDTHQYKWLLITANPYFSENLISCNDGYSFISNQRPTQQQADKEIALCGSHPEPEFFVGNDKPNYFLNKLGYNVDDYKRYVVSTIRTPWKNHISKSESVIYVRSDVFKSLILDK